MLQSHGWGKVPASEQLKAVTLLCKVVTSCVTSHVSRVTCHLLGPLPRPQRVEDGLDGGLGVVLRPLPRPRPVAVHLADIVTRLRVQSSCWGWGGPGEVVTFLTNILCRDCFDI